MFFILKPREKLFKNNNNLSLKKRTKLSPKVFNYSGPHKLETVGSYQNRPKTKYTNDKLPPQCFRKKSIKEKIKEK